MLSENYTIPEHIHRFGVWTAARAASTSRLKNSEVDQLFSMVRLKDSVNDLRNQTISDTEYMKWFKNICDKIIKAIPKINCGDFKEGRFSFGLAAKLVSIYIKTVEVIPTNGTSNLSRVAYPPIDNFLLKNIKKYHAINLPLNWSTFTWDTYKKWINELSEIKKDEPWWKLEEYWEINRGH